MNKTRLKNRVPLGNAIDKNLFNDLKAYSNETGIPMSKILDKSVEMYLKSVGKIK